LRTQTTPWQRVLSRFECETQKDFAQLFGCDAAKISRAVNDARGLINGRDQERLLKLAQQRGIALTASDLLPGAAP
jgi:hypothetical protein